MSDHVHDWKPTRDTLYGCSCGVVGRRTNGLITPYSKRPGFNDLGRVTPDSCGRGRMLGVLRASFEREHAQHAQIPDPEDWKEPA